MSVHRSVVLLGSLLALAVGQQAGRPIPEYTEAPAWPRPATTVADTAAPWNFGQVSGVATAADGNILVLHRGAHPIMLFDSAKAPITPSKLKLASSTSR